MRYGQGINNFVLHCVLRCNLHVLLVPHLRFIKERWFYSGFLKKLAEIADLNELPANILHDVYMHCSYDLAKNKHDVKRPLNELVRKHILTQGWQDRYLYTLGKKGRQTCNDGTA